MLNPLTAFHLSSLRPRFRFADLLLSCSIAFVALFFFHFHPFDNSDLGRHLTNGRLFAERFQIIGTNTYAYSAADFPVITHHWGSGVIFYFLHQLSGFSGLHLFAIVIYLSSILIVASLTPRQYQPITALCLVLLAPYFGERNQIRPELFTHLFLSLELLILELHRCGRLPTRYLYVLPLLQLLWINTHILFVLGFFVIGVYWLDHIIFSRSKSSPSNSSVSYLSLITYHLSPIFYPLTRITLLCLLASLINPFGLRGFLTPFNILNNYGFEITENQPIFEILQYFNQYNYIVFVLLVVVSWLLLIKHLRQSSWQSTFIPLILVTGFGFFGVSMIRQIALFALVFLAYMPSVIGQLTTHLSAHLQTRLRSLFVAGTLALLSVGLLVHHHYYSPFRSRFGLGLAPDSQTAGHFLQTHPVLGPIYNNYDIGSYLIYYLYPQQLVFVDNRPEAYPVSFFQEIYLPSQQSETQWLNLDSILGFNAIIFAHSDATPWAQAFLNRRLHDPAWVHIFHDQYVDILAKRNSPNQPLINQFEIKP